MEARKQESVPVSMIVPLKVSRSGAAGECNRHRSPSSSARSPRSIRGNDSGCCCALPLRAQRMALNVRLLLRPLKLMSVVEHKVDTVDGHR